MADIERQIAQLSPEQRRLVELLLRQQKEIELPADSTIPQRPQADAYPLSFTQQRIWFQIHIMDDPAGGNMGAALRLTGQLNAVVLEQVLNEIVCRHATLRTQFKVVEGQPMQVILPTVRVQVPVTDLTALTPEAREALARELATAEVHRTFDLTHAPLFRPALLRLDPEEHVLILNFNHIIADALSLGIIAHEITQLYTAFSYNRPSPLPPLPIQYIDFAAWQQQAWETGRFAEDLAFWKHHLAPPLPTLFPTTPEAANQALETHRKSILLQKDLADAVYMFCRREGFTLFVLVQAVLKTLLYRYTGQTDILIGVPIASRDQAELEGMIGPFFNTVVMRTDLSGNPTFFELLNQIRQTTLEVFAHKSIPFEYLVAELQPERDPRRTPFFETVLNYQGRYNVAVDLPGLKSSQFPINFVFDVDDPLIVILRETEAGITLVVEYKPALLGDMVVDHLQKLLANAVANPYQRLAELPLLTESERRQIVVDWNATHTEYVAVAETTRLHQLFEAHAAATPEATALVFEDQHLTYGELNRRTNQLAHYLPQHGVGPESIVGLCLERSLDMVIGIYGILKAGAVYMPLDPTYPTERLAFMLDDAQSPIVLTQQRFKAVLPEHTRTLCLDTEWERVAAESAENLAIPIAPDNLIYVIYTSGSTGKPKGAMNVHRGVCNRILWMQAEYHLTPHDRVLQKTPFSFDVSVWEFFWSLTTGGCLVVARPEGHKDSTYLVNLIADQQITTLHFVPSMLRVFLEEPRVGICRSLQRVMCSGEALPFDLQERFFTRIDAGLHNLYGPTEAAVDVTYWACERTGSQRVVPIGYPIANTQIYILDRDLQPVPVGIAGELYIGGVGLARGYLNRPELTADRFIPNPFAQTDDGKRRTKDEEWLDNMAGRPPSSDTRRPKGWPSSHSTGRVLRLYKTGDRARYLPTGAIEYLGRFDFQVKVRGFRIELGEIEVALEHQPGVLEAAVLAQESEQGDGNKRLVAYLVPRPGQTVSVNELREALQKELPDYMVPSAFIPLEAMPLTTSGKIDRRELPKLQRVEIKQRTEYVPPETPAEEIIAQIWAELLHLDRISIYDNFFEIGGHSLLAMQLIYRLNEAFEVNLTVRDLLQEPTIANLALQVEEVLIKELSTSTAQILVPGDG